MQIEILPYNEDHITKPDSQQLLTIGDNACLPGIIAGTFGWEAVNINAIDSKGNRLIVGACIKAGKIVMLPHFSYGPSSNPEIASKILQALKFKGFLCEWRMTSPVSEHTYTDKITTYLPLLAGFDEHLRQFGSNIRRKIRKCSLNGIVVKKGNSGMLHDFYGIYSRNMHRLGSPALPQQWFAALLSQYRNGEVGIWCAYIGNQPVGAAFMLEYRGFYEACWFSTNNRYNKLYTSYGLYSEMIRYAIEHGGRYFSFGRSTLKSSVHKYKQQWGGIDLPLVWNYTHPQGRNIRSFSFLTKLWNLLPYPVARFIGPVIAGKLY
ncbi:MAG: GNAT family N-acetyltransferase [Bacteroidota bacterium]